MLTRGGRIVRRKLSDEVLDRLMQLLSEGTLRPGDPMPSERQMMAQFGVGRPAIREAMQALASRGLVSINHGERARVLELTADSIIRQVDQPAQMMLAQSEASLDHLRAARVFFERGMVREAALKATEDDIADLEAIIAEQRGRIGDRSAFISADMRFHSRIAAISGNPIFAAVSEAILGWLRIHHYEILFLVGKEPLTIAEHVEIMDAIRSHDPDAAERAVTRHLERWRTRIQAEGTSVRPA